MGVNRFQPKGEKPLWQIIYDAVSDLDYGTELTWSQFHTMTGLDVQRQQSLITGKVNKQLLVNCNKELHSIRGVGYKVATPKEQMGYGTNTRKKKIRSQSIMSIRELTHLNLESLSPEDRNKLHHEINLSQTMLRLTHKKQVKGIEYSEKSLEKQREVLKEMEIMGARLEQLKKSLSTE